MTGPKPIRRHSKTRRAIILTQYHSVRKLRDLFAGLCIGVCLLTGLGFILCITTALISIAALRSNHPPPHMNETNGVIHIGVIAFVSGMSALLSARIAIKIKQAPIGTSLNPLPPATNEILPEAEILVRASGASDAAQRGMLLRAAAATAEDAEPQTLLRAASKTN